MLNITLKYTMHTYYPLSLERYYVNLSPELFIKFQSDWRRSGQALDL